MPPKRITRVTTPTTSNDKANSFIGIVDGKPSLVEYGSGIEDESMVTGEVDAEVLAAMGFSEAEIAKAQEDLDARIDAALFGESARATTTEVD